MRHLFIIDPLTSLVPGGDTSIAFMRAAHELGHEIFVCEQPDLYSSSGGPLARGTVSAFAQQLHLDNVPNASAAAGWYRADAKAARSLDDFQLVWMRKDPPVDEVFLTTCMLLEQADPTKTVVLNDPRSLRLVHEKLWALRFPELVPPQVVTANREVLRQFVVDHGKAVLKPLAFMGGMGVMVFEANDMNLKSAIDLLTAEGKKPAMAQAFLPGVRKGDKRVIVIDGEPIGALLRVPQKDDIRANLHVGGIGVADDIDDDDRRICATIGDELRRLGLFFVGLDVIGGRLTEVNVTSPTGVASIDVLKGHQGKDRLASRIVEKAVERHQRLTASA